MSENATLVKIVGNTHEPTIVLLVFLAVLVIIGILFITIKTTETPKNGKYSPMVSLFKEKRFRRTLGFTLVLFAVMILFIESSSLQEPLVALSTVFATVISLVSLNESGKLKEETLRREKTKEFKQHIKDLIDWAVETFSQLTIAGQYAQTSQEIAQNLIKCRNELMKQKVKSIVVFNQLYDISDKEYEEMPLIKTMVTAVDHKVVAFVDSLFAFSVSSPTNPELSNISDKSAALTKDIRYLLDIISKSKAWNTLNNQEAEGVTPMRKTDREITDRAEIESIIQQAQVCRVALAVDNVPYIVPMNYGYRDNALYFHCAAEGKKLDMVRRNNQVCFEMDIDYELLSPTEKVCTWGSKYRSIIGFGKAFIIEKWQEKAAALNIITAHHGAPHHEFSEKELEQVRIIKIGISSMTGKKAHC
jgi:uncharacterized protein